MIHFQDPNPDEFLAGYIGRVARMNQAARKQVWRHLHAKSGSTGWPRPRKTWTVPLAQELGLAVPDLLTEHTLEPLLHALCPPVVRAKGLPPNVDSLPAIRRAEIAVPDRQLRLCPSCIQEDIDFWGYSYWRRSHQICGLRWCTKHRCGLLEASDRTAKDLFPEECDTGLPAASTHLMSASIQRYAEICEGLLEMGDRIYVLQARYRMRRRAYALGIRTSILGNRPNISDTVKAVFPAMWLATVIPNIQGKMARTYFPAIDGVCRGGTAPARGTTYAVVLATLYDSADAALMDVSRKLTSEETSEMAEIYSPSLSGTRSNLVRSRRSQVQMNAIACAAKTYWIWPFFPSSVDKSDL